MEETMAAVASNGGDPSGAVGGRMDIKDAIARLTEEQRELVTLKFIQGLSTADVAEITGRREGAVRALQFRALSALRDLLGEEGKKS